jgi:hypothetical protein
MATIKRMWKTRIGPGLEKLKRRRQRRSAFATSALYQRVGGDERIGRAAAEEKQKKGLANTFS